MVGIGTQFAGGWTNSREGCPCQAASTSTYSRSPSSYVFEKSRGCRIFPGGSSLSRERKLYSSFNSPLSSSTQTVVRTGLIVPVGDGLSAISSSSIHGLNGTSSECGAACSRLDLAENWSPGFLLKSWLPGMRMLKRLIEGKRAPGIRSGPCLSLSWANEAEVLSLRQLGFPSSFQCKSSTKFNRFALKSSKQLNPAADDFWKPSTRRSSLSSRTSLQKVDSELVGAAQPPGKSPSASACKEISLGRSSSLGNAVLSKSKSESPEDQWFGGQLNKVTSDHSRSPRSSSKTSVGFPDSGNSYPTKTSETAPSRIPYFKASNASYKAQVVQAAKTVSQQVANSSAVSQSPPGTPSSSHGKTVRTLTQTTFSQPKIKSISPPGTSTNATRDADPAEASSGSSRNFFTQLNDHDDLRSTDKSGKWSSSADFSSTPTTSLGRSWNSSPSSTKMSANFSSRSRLSLSESSSARSSSEDVKLASLASEHMPQRVSTPSRISRKDSGQSLPSSESLDRLHQQLEEQARDNSSKALLQRPLGPEESSRLRDRLKEQKQKSIQEIRRRLFQHRRRDGQEDEFSCAVEPDSLILGEYVVHKKVGVGKYIGMKSEVPPGKSNPSKYIYLKYADGIAKLKARQAHRLLYRYHLPGEIGGAPSLSKLKDPSLWQKRKNKGKVAIQKMVVNMMELYIHRLKQSRTPYPKIPIAVARFAAKFPHTPTPDQLQAFVDVERDMTERDLPMDRLICGDVGFGKTEVALRAMCIAVAAGKQVMVLTPSTVLAKQHYETIRDRFAGFLGVKVALLCRFQKESERKDLVVGIHDGSLSIVVGTHSLLGSQIRYHNLGLLVIDEEQRFGVKQKEKITCLKTSVDVLTLTATPIPRTLYLAMSGFRDASLLTTPPPERRPIQTHLVEYDEAQARTAIEFELARGGQVFYVVPRVKGIDKLQQTLQSQFPDVKVAIAHGKQPASALEDTMEKFCEGETKILLCTNIIESGLDIRMVNTIIVEDVQHFGLAQLYQLRGRVGRAHREAHAYLFHSHKSHLTDEALERLVALQDCCDLGQGFQLAERDMAIRGIGSLFGEQQSGDAAKIGTDLYFEMLLEGLSKVDSQHLPPVEYEDVQLELGVDSHIPSDYIKSSEEREAVIRIAERAARESLRALMLSTNRLRDQYGKEPASMEMLLKTLYVRRMAADLGIHRIRTHRTSIMMETNMSLEAFEMITCSIPSDSVRASLTFGTGCIEIQGLIGLPKERQMERVFCCLADMFNCLPSFVKYI